MHIREAREDGERQERIDLLPAWREAPFYNARERAALAWTEAVTLLPQTGVPDDVYEQARAVFSPTELAYLTLAIVAINGWNRLNVSFRIPPEVEDVSVERVYHA
ncbi:MAG: carboxymuconolactone decarboxylase family protein, partial [Thermorudis peleae]|nr:carboxymuconolactone decarboxylase family protein [Thermorudis peleae]